jgi:hypothetical protein
MRTKNPSSWESRKALAHREVCPGAVALKAFNPKMDEKALQEVEFGDYRGDTSTRSGRPIIGRDSTDPPRNAIEDWALSRRSSPSGGSWLKVLDQEVAGFRQPE